MILFGSGLGGEYVLDTVFVVSDFEPYNMDVAHQISGDQVFYESVMEPLYRYVEINTQFTFYQGATHANRVEGMFSFFPCLPKRDAVRGFPRPIIELPNIVNPRSFRGPKATKMDEPGEAYDAWSEVVHQVLDKGLALGLRADTPGFQ